MAFKNPTKAIRKVLFELLCQPNAIDAYFNAAQIVELCNAAAGYEGYEGINESVVVWALTYGDTKYNLAFDFVGADGNMGGHFYAAVSHRIGNNGQITAAGRFTSAGAETAAWQRLISGELARINIRNWDLSAISADSKLKFKEYVAANKDKIKKKNAEIKEKESNK